MVITYISRLNIYKYLRASKKCHACHAKWRSRSECVICVWCMWVICMYVICVCVSDLCVMMCVCVCVWVIRMLLICMWVIFVWCICVCVMCVWVICVCEWFVSEWFVCEWCVCVWVICVWVFCVDSVCVWVNVRGGGGGAGGGGGRGGWRARNKNPTQWCGEKETISRKQKLFVFWCFGDWMFTKPCKYAVKCNFHCICGSDRVIFPFADFWQPLWRKNHWHKRT